MIRLTVLRTGGARDPVWFDYGCGAKVHRPIRDAETGNDYFSARYYTPSYGRFMSPDPANAGADLYNPQSWNAYTYVLGNPLANVDPSGMSFVPCKSPDSIACVGNDPDFATPASAQLH